MTPPDITSGKHDQPDEAPPPPGDSGLIGSHSELPSEPDPEPYAGPPLRIPNLGHALLFLSFAGLMLILSQLALMALGQSIFSGHGTDVAVLHPKQQLAAMAATYLITLLASWRVYPLLWHRPFLDGLAWHWSTAREQAVKLIALGLILGGMVQLVTYFITPPKSIPIDEFFLKPSDAWLITLFGTLVAPVFEEVAFRGFLVPAFAIAYDWLSLARTPEAHARWRTTASLTPAAFLFSAILSSILFALLHFQQVAHAGAALAVLFSVSLVLTFVRIKTNSVAASTLVHASYNSFVFLTVLIATGGYRHLDRMTR
jgi:membrane protease YdiL (CAAX protease family)